MAFKYYYIMSMQHFLLSDKSLDSYYALKLVVDNLKKCLILRR